MGMFWYLALALIAYEHIASFSFNKGRGRAWNIFSVSLSYDCS